MAREVEKKEKLRKWATKNLGEDFVLNRGEAVLIPEEILRREKKVKSVDDKDGHIQVTDEAEKNVNEKGKVNKEIEQ